MAWMRVLNLIAEFTNCCRHWWYLSYNYFWVKILIKFIV